MKKFNVKFAIFFNLIILLIQVKNYNPKYDTLTLFFKETLELNFGLLIFLIVVNKYLFRK